MFELFVRWFAWGLDTSLKAVLVAVVAACVLKLLRLQDSNVRHRVWTGVLIGMFLLPVLTPLVPALRLPLMPSPDWLVAWTEEPALPETAPIPVSEVPIADRSVPLLGPFATQVPESDQFLADRSLFQSSGVSPLEPDSPSTTIPRQFRSSEIEPFAEPQPLAPLSPPSPPAAPSRRAIAIAIAYLVSGAWLLVSTLLLARLTIGLWLAARLRRSSLAIDPAELGVASATAPRVRESAGIHIPLTVGCLKPLILLPTSWRQWPTDKLHAVLAHEQMHVQRGDCVVALLAEINCCLYWFHPLASWLKAHLSALAEQACDDAAIHSIGDRARYARHLLEVAADVSRHRGRLVPAGLSMARRSNVEQRILSILDFTRPLSHRLTWAKALFVLSVMVPLIALAAAVQPFALSPSNEANPAPVNDVPPQASTASIHDDVPVAKSDENVATKRGEAPLQEPKPNPIPPAQESAVLSSDQYQFAGTVLDDRGQPLAGAKISLAYWSNMPADESLQRLATSDANGKFSFTKKLTDLSSKTSPRSWIGAPLIAVKSGYGFSIASIPALETSGRLTADLTDRERSISEWHFGKPSNEIVLPADDVPIRGRIVDSEGQPVAGVKVVAAQLWRGQSGTLDDWLVKAANPGADDRTAKQHLQHFCQSGMHVDTGELSSPHALVWTPVHSDADGRFTLAGLGRDRIAELYLSGPGIASMTLLARTRQGDVIRLPESAATPGRDTKIYYPANFTCIAAPSVPVEGRVTEHSTDKPIAGWTVLGHKLATNNVHGSFEAAYNHTKTDADGRFRLEGLPLGDNIFRVVPPKKSGYFAAEADVTTTAGAKPVVRDVAVRRGVIARGRVTDFRMGKPVNGTVSYFAFSDNPHLRSTPGFDLSTERVGTDKDGRYEITILPGSGLLTFMASPDEDFPRGAGADKIEGPKSVTNAVFFRTEPYLVMADNANLLSAVNPAADATEITHDLTLTSGRSLTCRIRRADGQPLGKTYLYGQQSFVGWFYRHTGDSFQVRGYFPDPGRRVMVYQPEGNLIGWQDLTGEAPNEFEIVLKPAGTFVGRIVDGDGAPLEGLSIGSAWDGFFAPDRKSPGGAKTWGELPANLNGTATLTDKDGRFELPGVVPGLIYAGAVSGPVKRNGQVQMSSLGRVFENATAESGETKDLGDLRIKKRNSNDEKQDQKQAGDSQYDPKQGDAKKEEPAPQENPGEPAAPETVRGRVRATDGKPIGGATIYVAPEPYWSGKNDDRKPRPVAQADESGAFELVAQPNEVAAAARLRILITAPGYGPELLPLSDAIERRTLAVSLPPDDVPIRGRILTLEGQPIVGAKINVRAIRAMNSGDLKPYIDIVKAGNGSNYNFDKYIETLPHIKPLETDTDGRFQLTGIGRNRVAEIEITGPAIQNSRLRVMTLQSEPLLARDGRGFAMLAREMGDPPVFGASFEWLARPSRPIVGTVVDAKTRQPLAGINVSALFQAHATTDANGRFELTGAAKAKDYRLTAHASDQPYLVASRTVADEPGLGPMEVSLEMTRGIVVSGRVIDRATGKPLNARLRYFPLYPNEFVLTGIGGSEAGAFGAFTERRADASGEFSIPVLPGPGFIGISAPDGQAYQPASVDAVAFFKQQKVPYGTEQSKHPENSLLTAMGSSGWSSVPQAQFHAIELLNLSLESDDSTHRDIQLVAANRFTGVVLDPDGQLLSGVSAFGLADRWYQNAKPLSTPEFAVTGLGKDEKRLLLFRHDARRLVAAAEVTADAPQPLQVKLQPWGEVSGRLLDTDGTPLANLEIGSFVDAATGEKVGRLPGHPSTDDQGRFHIDGLVPGITYALRSYRREQPEVRVVLNSGEKRDVGDVTGKYDTKTAAAAPKPADGAALQPEKDAGRPNPEAKLAEKSPAAAERARIASPAAGNADPAAGDITIRGQVVNERGQPIAGAKLFTPVFPRGQKRRSIYDARLTEKGQTDADGKFAISIASDEFEGIFRGASQPKQLPLVAHAPGHGAEWLDLSPDVEVANAQIVLRPEKLIEGRLINSEGRPAAGAKIAVKRMFRPKDGDTLDAFLAAWKRSPNEAPWNAATNVTAELTFAHATSDQEGRFVIHGVPLERIAELEFTAASLVVPSLWVVNRDGFSAREHYQGPSTNQAVGAHMQLAERVFNQVGLPAYELSGRVTSDDGQPVANVVVSANNGYHVGISTQTGADGRYRLPGLAHQKRIGVRYDAPHDSGLLSHDTIADHQTNEPEKTLDVVLRRGVTIRGRVTDKATGQGVSAGLRFVPLPENDFVKRPDYTPSAMGGQGFCNATGNFELQVIPGPGVLMVSVARGQAGGQVTIGGEVRGTYRQGRFSDEDRQRVKVRPEENGMQSFFRDGKFIEFILDHSAVKYVNSEAGKTPDPLEIQVDRGQTVDLEFVDGSGHPVQGVFVSGVTEMWPITAQLTDPRCTVYALGPDRPRHVVARHAERGLAGSVTLKGDEKSPVRVELVKTASLKGRAIDADGSPIVATDLVIDFASHSIDELLRFQDIKQPKITTDNDGRFTIPSIVPGERFSIHTEAKGAFRYAKLAKEQQSLTPGQQLDLGNVIFANRNQTNADTPLPPGEGAARRAAGERVLAAERATVTGLVLLPTGQPAANTHVAVVAFPNKPRQGGDLSRNGEVLAEGKTDDAGRFQFQLNGVSSTSHKYANLIARQDGSAIRWQNLNLDMLEATATLKLEAEEPIRGRLIDLEGQPVSNIRLRIRSVMKRTTAEWSQEGIGFDGESLPAAWLAPLTTDQDGRFAIHGIPSAHGVGLHVAGSDRFAPQDILLNTGMAEQRGERDATYRSLVRNAKPGEEIVLPLAPSQIFEGTIRYDDTKEPVPHARITIWASQQRNGGSMTSVEGQTDAAGHYRIVPRPGIRFGVKAYPPNGAAYLVRQTTDDIRWESGDRIKQVDLTLPAGILIRGHIVTAGTKEPVAGASIQFIPQSSTSVPPLKGVVTGWQGIQVSGKDGSYQIAFPPVPGHLLVNHDTGNFILEEIGSTVLYSGKPGGQRHYAHAIQKIDPAPDAKSLDLTFELQPGATIAGRMVDQQGQPVNEAFVISRLHIWSGWLTWHGNTERWPSSTGRFELKGLQEGLEYPTHFLDPKRRLGATANLKAGENEPTIVLEPCGSATARFLDEKGQPLADHRPNLDFIITPGVHRYDFESQQAGQLAADSDFAANVDRANHHDLKTDADGKLTIPALIPGATYAISTLSKGRWQIAKEFQVRSRETLDLGDIVQPSPNSQAKSIDTAAAKPAPPLSPGAQAGSVTVTGIVLLPNGKPAPGATVRAAAPLWAMMKPLLGAKFQSPMSEVKTDNAGRFSISFPTRPFGDVSKLDANWQQLWKKTPIAASLTDYGPAWIEYEDVEANQRITLKLVEDVPIRGRVIDLEGRPVPGTTVKIGGPRASENEDLSAWIDGIKAGELPWTVASKAPREVESRVIGVPTAATTNAQGEFEIRGLGRERLVKLVLEGESVAHREITVATRAMEPIQQKLTTSNPREQSSRATHPVFGADFTFTAGPARVIEGIVLDAKSRQPLAGVAVESDRLTGYPYSNHRVLKTTTDNDGRFRLLGMPKGNENRLLVLPNDEQPYFMREVEVPDPVGLGPAKMEIELHRGLWITGRVTDKATGAPIPAARLHYLPFCSNEFAQKLPEFDNDGNVDGDQARYQTSSDGRFRLVGLPGPAIVGAESTLKDYRAGVGFDELKAPKNRDTNSPDTYRNPIWVGPKWPDLMQEINPPADATELVLDFQLDPGQTVQIHITDVAGNPLTGASLQGEKSADGPTLTAANLGPRETRTLIVRHKDKNLGRVATIGPEQIASGQMTVPLQPVATVSGRVLKEDGTPLSGMAIAPRVLPQVDFGLRLQTVATDAEGRFTMELLPGCQYDLAGEGGGFQFAVVAKKLSIHPGETKDLGTVKLNKNGQIVAATTPEK